MQGHGWLCDMILGLSRKLANIDTINNTENNNKLESTAHCSTFLLGDMNSKYECILTDFNTTNVTRKDELF